MKKIFNLFPMAIIITGIGCNAGKLQGDNPLFVNNWVLSELNGTPVQTV